MNIRFNIINNFGILSSPEKFGTGSLKIYSHSISAHASCRENIFGRVFTLEEES
jgi:hypothetical protein